MHVQTYLQFNGRCEEALDFYRKAIGAEVTMLMRFKDSPEQPDPAEGSEAQSGMEDKVMHSSFQVGGTTLMATDGDCNKSAGFQGFALTLQAADEAEAERYFAALSDGGEVKMPLTKTFFSPKFGMLADRFGVSWMVLVQHAE